MVWFWASFSLILKVTLFDTKNVLGVIWVKLDVLPFLQPPTTNPSKPYLGQFGFYPILFEIFSGGYFGLSGPLGFMSNPFGLHLESNLGQIGFLTFSSASNKEPFKTLSWPNWILSLPVRNFFRRVFWPIWICWVCTATHFGGEVVEVVR